MRKNSEFLLEIKTDSEDIMSVSQSLKSVNKGGGHIIGENVIKKNIEDILKLPKTLYVHPLTGADHLKSLWQLNSGLLFQLYGVNNIQKMFQMYGKLSMELHDHDLFNRQPDKISAFRGTDSKDSKFMSCSLDIHYANYYASIKKGKVIEGYVFKEDVLALYLEELEVIINPDLFYCEKQPLKNY